MALLSNSRAGIMRRVVSKEYFRRIVHTWAYEKWKSKESRRRIRNSLQALQELGFCCVFVTDTDRRMLVQIRAYEIYERRKDADALEDWCQAEEDARRYYDVNG